MRHFLFFLLLFCFLGDAIPAFTESIEITSPDFYEKRKFDLPSGASANITVYLKSAGDMVDRIRILLLTMPSQRLVSVKRSDQNGEAIFNDVPPGRYIVLTQKSKNQKKERTTVEVGDVSVEPSKKDGDLAP